MMVITVSLGGILKAIVIILFIAFVVWTKTPPKNGGKK